MRVNAAINRQSPSFTVEELLELLLARAEHRMWILPRKEADTVCIEDAAQERASAFQE